MNDFQKSALAGFAIFLWLPISAEFAEFLYSKIHFIHGLGSAGEIIWYLSVFVGGIVLAFVPMMVVTLIKWTKSRKET